MKNLNSAALALALGSDDPYDRLLLSIDADDGCPNCGLEETVDEADEFEVVQTL